MWSNACSLQENVLSADERTCILQLLVEALYNVSQARLVYSIVQLQLFFLLEDLSIDQSRVLRFPITFLLEPISPFALHNWWLPCWVQILLPWFFPLVDLIPLSLDGDLVSFCSF